ncbi:MAG TPA: hypothetical protein VMN60_11975 [Longimicrobiales bacterium]|nr:hypothetical protein [Longimicrobiales bacterium]
MTEYVRTARGIATALSALCLAAAVSPATAQQRDPVRADSAQADSSRVFVRGGVYDKPYQTRLLGRTAIGGYAEAHARYQRVDGLRDDVGFEAKRFNLFASAFVSDVVRFAVELEFEDGGQEILLEFAAIDVRIHPSLALRGGMILSPLGKFNLSHDSPLNDFTDRPLVSTDILGVALSEPGFGALGQLRAGRSGRVTYELYATNGFHDGLIMDSEDGTRIPLGRHNFEDNNGSPAAVGRLAWSPQLGFELGVSAHHGAYNTFNLEGATVDQRRDLSIVVVDAEAQLLGVRFSGEAARAMLDVPEGLLGIYASAQRGLYVEGVRDFWRGRIGTLPNSVFAAKTRFDYVDFDNDRIGTSVAQVTVGLNFRPTEDSVIKLDFVRGRGRDQFNNLGAHAFVLLSLATYF